MQASRGWGVIVRYRYLRRGRLRKAFGKRKRVVVKRSAGADLATVAPDGTLEESPATTTLPARPLPELKVVPPSDVAVIAIGVAADATVPAEVEPAATPPAPVQPAPNPYLLTESDDPIAALDSWVERARAADAPEVVFMFSGTIHIQEKRGNRPIRLTREYLDRGIPVFFNYWRWRDTDTPPEFSHPLLLQSPIDITPQLLERLLAADFGPKRKLMFASFPHEEMVRVLSRATQAGWTTIYDARDDWEEFEKVGMAKWYDFAYETYITRSCDIVTAISRPLARKLGTMSGREDIHVVPNALDPGFPAPPGAREPKDPPVIGYFGHLTDKWFDWDLVLAAAKEYPTWRFELAGHQAPEGLQLPENVVLLGLLGHAELANLSRNWSAALIPFKVSALGEAVDPIKVYEYLHLGLPTLSSYMPQMRDYPGVTITESAAEFVAELPRIAASRLDETTVRQWLSHNRWPDRVDRYSELAQEVLAQPRSGFWPLLTADAVSA
jgi:glycosyltransferase involved in cell wall biosynthesis